MLEIVIVYIIIIIIVIIIVIIIIIICLTKQVYKFVPFFWSTKAEVQIYVLHDELSSHRNIGVG